MAAWFSRSVGRDQIGGVVCSTDRTALRGGKELIWPILACPARLGGNIICRVANNPSTDKKRFGVRPLLYLFYALPFLLVLGVCGYLAYSRLAHKPPPVREISAKPFAIVKINDLTAGLFTQGDALQASGNDLFIEFRDAHGKLVDAGEVSFELDLHMPDMVMHSIGKVMRTSTPGQYRTTVEPQMAGEWTAKITISGPQVKAEASLPIKVM